MEKWIKCSDRLPEDGDEIIFYVPYFKIVFAGIYKDERFYKMIEWEPFKSVYSISTEPYVITHWMPLPELPTDCSTCDGNGKVMTIDDADLVMQMIETGVAACKAVETACPECRSE